MVRAAGRVSVLLGFALVVGSAGASTSERLDPLERQRLVERNPFQIDEDSRKPAVAPVPTPEPQAAPATPAAPVRLKLMGTLAGGAVAWAVILDEAARVEAPYAVGASVGSDGWVVAAVERRSVLLRRAGRELRLTMDDEGPPAAAAPQPRPTAATPAVAALRRDGDRVVVSQADLASNFPSLAHLLLQMRVQPEFADGSPAGFRVVAVREGSFVERLGARKGDVITKVAGQPVTSVQQAFQLYRTLQNERGVSVEVIRDGAPRVLNFEVE